MHSHQASSPASVRTVVPIVALVTTIVLQSIQSLVMQVRGARSGVGLTDVLMQWDSQWMTLISRYGYSGFAMGTAGTPDGEPIQWQSIAFFPGYPWMVRAVAEPVRVLSGAEITVGAAFAVSVVASVVLVWGLGLLSSRFLWPRVTGRAAGTIEAAVLTTAAGVLALGAPMSVVYFMAYSEAMFTALAVWIIYFLLGRHYTAAGILTCVAGLTRLTAVVLVVALVIAAVIELVLQWRSASGAVAPSASEKHQRILPAWASAGMAAVIGSLGIIGYISWANGQAAGVGGYFAAQERGWHSGFDGGRATWDWLTSKPSTLWVSDATRYAEGTMPGYAISSWSMVVVAALCVASLWPLYTRRLPWQLWWPAIAMAGMTLGSAGVMHSRPRLLLLTVLFLLLPLAVSLVAQVFRACRSRRAGRHRWLPVATGVVIGVCWCVVGFWVSAEMLIGFRYAI